MYNRYKAFFAAYKKSVKRGNPLSRQEVISDFTEGKTESLKDLSDFALAELVRRLNSTSAVERSRNDRSYPGGQKANKMRKAIISIFYRMDKTAEDAKRWSEKQGVYGVKKRFNEYTKQELFVLIRIAEKIFSDYQKGIRTALSENS